MKLRFWQFALWVPAIVGLGLLTNANNLEYIVSWIIAVTSVSLLGFYLTELILHFVKDSDGDKQKPAEPAGAPGPGRALPDSTQSGLARVPTCFIFE